MLSENEKRIQELSRELGACLYEQSQIKKFNNLGEIEETVRDLMIQYVNPEIGIFLSKQVQKKPPVGREKWKVFLGEFPITEKQAKKLEIKSRTQMSPMLEKNYFLRRFLVGFIAT